MNQIKRSWMTFASFAFVAVAFLIGCSTFMKGSNDHWAKQPSNMRGSYAQENQPEMAPWYKPLTPPPSMAFNPKSEKRKPASPRKPNAVTDAKVIAAELKALQKSRKAFNEELQYNAHEKKVKAALLKHAIATTGYPAKDEKGHAIDIGELEATRLTPVAETMENDYFFRAKLNRDYENTIGMNKHLEAETAMLAKGGVSKFSNNAQPFSVSKPIEKQLAKHPLFEMQKFSANAVESNVPSPKSGSVNSKASEAQSIVQAMPAYQKASIEYKEARLGKAQAKSASTEKPPMPAAPKSYYSYDDYYDPNDYQSSAFSLTAYEDRWLSGINGSGKQYDDDWFQVYVSSSYKRLILDLRFSHSGGDIDMKLYDSYGYQVASSTSSSSDEYIDITLSTGGYYYVKIYYSNVGNSYDFKWKTMFTGAADDYYEPNDSSGSYYDLASYDNFWLNSIHGVGTAADNDWYRVYIPTGRQRLIVDLRYSHYSGGDIDMAVFNSSGTTQLASSTSSNDDEYLDLSGLAPGYYLIKVYPFTSSPSNPNVYDMKWYSVATGPSWSEDGYEPNDSRSTGNPEMTHGQTISGNQFDDDWFKFYVNSGAKRIKLDLNFNSSYGDIDLELYDDLGRVWGSSRSGGTSREFIDVTVPDGNRYYWARVFYGNTGSSYTLNLQMISTFTDDVYEPNDSTGEATDLSSKQNIWLSNYQGLAVLHDADYYRINVQEGFKNVIVDLRYVHQTGKNIRVDLRSSNGTSTIASSDNQRDDEYIDFTVPSAGTYYIVVNGDYADNQYDLRWFTREDQSSFKDGHSGMWFNAATNGQGNNVTFLNRDVGQDEVWMSWYTYDPTHGGTTAAPMWYVAQGPVSGDTANLTVYMTNGGQFNSPPSVGSTQVGTASLKVIDCANARLTYNFTQPGVLSPNGVIPLTMITPNLVQGGKNICSGASVSSQATNSGIQRGHTGLWYNKDTSGQGFDFDFVNTAEGTVRAISTWFTYVPGQTHPAQKHWFYMDGPSMQAGSNKIAMNIYSPQTGKFNQNPPNPNVPLWGKGQYEFNNCASGLDQPPSGYFKFVQGANTAVDFNQPPGPGNQYSMIPLWRLSPQLTYNGQPLCTNW